MKKSPSEEELFQQFLKTFQQPRKPKVFLTRAW